MNNALPHNKAEHSAQNSSNFTAPTSKAQKEIDVVGRQILQLAVALNVCPLQLFDAIHKQHLGRDGTNLDKELGLPLGTAARAVLSITGFDK